MSIDVGTAIPVPAGTDNYNLVLDLTAMKNGILASIADIVTELGQRPETGSNAAFNTLVTTLGGTFGGSVTINSPNGGSAAVINNSNIGFGITKGATGFNFNGSKFVSTHAVQIVDGVGANDAVTQTYVAGQMAIAAAWDAIVQASVVALDARSVIRYNGLQNWAPNANYANSAGSAAYATNATNATSSNDADRIGGRRIVTGKSGQFYTDGGHDENKSISFGTTFASIPTVVYSITEDDGVQSMLSSIDTVSTTGFTINVTNSNSNHGENYKITWIAIGA